MTAFNLDINNGIATLEFDLPGEKVNKMTLEVLEELEGFIDGLTRREDIKLLLIKSGKPDNFIAGADIASFSDIFKDNEKVEQMIRKGHRICNKVEQFPFPTVAAINGACLGGGMELALSCKYRIVSDHPKTLLGLPEVSLGIIPGWGGTQRMPRLVGLVQGLGLVLGAKPVNAKKSLKINLADAIAPWEFFDEKIGEFIQKVLSPGGEKKILEQRSRKGFSTWLLEGNPLGRWMVFSKAEKDVQGKTKGHYPAPRIALELIKKTCREPLDKGLEEEIRTILQELSPAVAISENLIQLFFTSEALKKDSGVKGAAQPSEVKSAGVIGAGVMGSGIAFQFSYKGYPTRLKDVNWDVVGKGYGNIWGIYRELIKKKRLKPYEATMKFQQVGGTTDYSGFGQLDLVVEAAVENIELKQQIFQELESVVSDKCILATNTSSFRISDLAKPLRHPERFIGMHFFNPANRMPLVEIVPGEQTSQDTIATAVEFCKKIGKTPIVVGDCAGFVVNRIFVMGASEILRLLEEGVHLKKISKAMLDFGMPMDPFLLFDEVGNDVNYKVMQTFEETYGERAKMPQIAEKMYQKKFFGKKVGKGYYLYDGKKRTPNPEVKHWALKTPPGLNSDEIMDRITVAMVNEAARCLEEKVIGNPAYLDMALVMGTGYPPFRGGLLRFADSIGIGTIIDRLEGFSQKYGERFTPCKKLREMDNKNENFYDFIKKKEEQEDVKRGQPKQPVPIN